MKFFFRYCTTRFIHWQERMFKRIFCRKGYHCACYYRDDRCCECGSYKSEISIPEPTRISEK